MEETKENVNSDVLADTNIENAKEKQSNKTFTQSEVDKLIKAQTEVALDKYSNFDTIKGELEDLKQKQKERDEAELSELDLSTKKNQELTQEIELLKGAKSELERKNMKQRVLNDPKFSEMPSAYKSQVTLGDNEEEVLASAEKQLLQFNSDFKTTKGSFGVPKEHKKDVSASGTMKGYDQMKALAAEKLKSYQG